MPVRVSALDMGRFGIDSARGFLPLADPKAAFSDDAYTYFKELERVGQQILELLKSHALERTLDTFPSRI